MRALPHVRVSIPIVLLVLAALVAEAAVAAPRVPLSVLRVGADGTFRPIAFRDMSGKLLGYDVDFAAELAARLGVRLDYQTMAWDGIIPTLQSKKIDAITSMAVTEQRKQVVTFSDGTYMQIIVGVVRSDRSNFDPGPDDLKNLRVGVQGNTSASAAVAQLGVRATAYNSITDAYDDLLLGRLDVVVVESVNAGFSARYVYSGKLRVSAKPIVDRPAWVAVAMRKEDTELHTAVNWAIAEMAKDGTLDRILKKWFGEGKYRP